MEDIRIPSPSAILDPPPTKLSRSPPAIKPTTSDQTVISALTNKPKQSKSRNGCSTCKAKRLKCDESKPTCLQCKKRNVECGGYKKDFKWRPFEETNVAGKASTSKVKKTSSPPGGISSTKLSAPSGTGTKSSLPQKTRQSTKSIDFSLGLGDLLCSHTPSAKMSDMSHSSSFPLSQKDLSFRADKMLRQSKLVDLDEDIIGSSLKEVSSLDDSPWLSFPTDLSSNPESTPLSASEEPLQRQDDLSFSDLLEDDNEDIEDIVRLSNQNGGHNNFGVGGNAVSTFLQGMNAAPNIPRGPNFEIASPEMLVLQFDRFTCGILSVKDGVHENPWRTLIWPLAKDTPALYHALFSLAAFHSSKDRPALRVNGVDHMRKSITCMVQDIQNMRADAALATSLALAFADTWDQNTRTCIQHLRGAKALVSQVVTFGLQSGICGEDLDRVRFLYNTWLYMDVIARLTSRAECGDQDVDFSLLQFPRDAVHEIDPLMGCATTLFPLIDRVARLIQRVRRTESNSISLVSQAIELKRLVEQWEPPDWFEPPEDPTSEVQHSIQTAHAYRWATILYLHQAVPEMPSEPDSGLAKRVLILLATVPPSSRTTIIQMFPLLAAGCEATQEEDRQWVLDRWAAIQSRLMLGSIDRCIDVVREVWTRRDVFEAEKQRHKLREVGRPDPRLALDSMGRDIFAMPGSSERSLPKIYAKDTFGRPVPDDIFTRLPSRRSSAVSGLENIEFEKTVRGHLHWVKVMQEWGWEGNVSRFHCLSY
ncbi:hypothetical protein FE257_001746 [Aspergillus nanangensis]|uniref:Zn(2)-C6 fungal-type domain-containing protein n=1 Tax=Aspergillus nanangensis TaxID=2582783 RepID=A0AAD4GPI4_ASPNN|nr:hypothetical protein FE257_001746 [Aspergillus nanangensis]